MFLAFSWKRGFFFNLTVLLTPKVPIYIQVYSLLGLSNSSLLDIYPAEYLTQASFLTWLSCLHQRYSLPDTFRYTHCWASPTILTADSPISLPHIPESHLLLVITYTQCWTHPNFIHWPHAIESPPAIPPARHIHLYPLLYTSTHTHCQIHIYTTHLQPQLFSLLDPSIYSHCQTPPAILPARCISSPILCWTTFPTAEHSPGHILLGTNQPSTSWHI